MKIKPKTGFESISYGHCEATIVPFMLSVSIFILGIIELFREIRSDKKALDMDEEDISPTVVTEVSDFGIFKRFLFAFCWIGGFALTIYLVGFFPSTLAFALCYTKSKGYGWIKAGVFAICFSLLLYLVFQLGFKSQLYKGILLPN